MTFISKVKQGAINGWHTHQILPSISIAQAILESASGTSSLGAKYLNLFGIKASDDWTGKVINLPTREHGANGSYQTNANFRWYDSWADSMLDHAAFFTNTAWRVENYKHVVGEKDYKKAAQALQSAGYATDPQYATKLIARVEQNNLTQYDTEAFNGAPSNAETIKKTVGGTLTELAKSAIKQYNVTLIGDSLGVGTQPKLTDAFKSFTHDVLGSRQITHATNNLNGTYVLQSLKDYGQLKDIVVVILGTNRGVTDTEINNFVAIAGTGRKVIFVDTNSSVAHRQSVSDTYKRASERHNNVYFANWMNHSNSLRSRYYGSDNVHMTAEGYQAHADFIKMAVYEVGVGVKTTTGTIGTVTEYIGIDEIDYKEGDLVSPKGESVIYNHPANELWGSKTGDRVIWIESILEVDSDDPQFILNEAVKVMKANDQPAAQYVVDLAELPEDVSIGDWGYVLDHEFNPPLYIHARMLEIITSETDLNANKAVIGNVTEVFPADKSDIKLIQADLKDARDNLVRDYRKGQPILMLVNSTNGSTLGDKYTETELVAKVTQGAEDLTNRFITYKWERVSNDSGADNAYNKVIETETTNRLIITSKDIVNNLSTFVVRVYDEDLLINQSSITIKHVDTALWTDTSTPPSDAKDGAAWVDESGKQWILKDGEWEERVDQAVMFTVKADIDVAKEIADNAKAEADDARQRADDALEEVGISTDLAQTAKDLADTAKANAQTAISNANSAVGDASNALTASQNAVLQVGTAMSDASQAIASANTAKTNAQTALTNAQTALSEVGSTKTSVNSLTTRVDEVEGELEFKASQTTVDGINGTISTHTTTLSQHATAISSKAELQLVNTIKGTVDTHTTDISQNATDIASKASETSVDTLTGTVSEHTTKINQNATDISARLTTTQVNSLVDSKGLATATYVTNQITATATGIRTDLTKVEGKIDNLEIGGRNYVLDSPNLGKHFEARPTTTITSATPNFEVGGKTDGWRFTVHGGVGERLRAVVRSYLEPDTQYTLSATVKENRNINLIVGTLLSDQVYNIGHNQTQRVVFTTMSDSMGQLQITFHTTVADIDASYIDIGLWGLKIEKGTIATDWSPAPEDSLMENDFKLFKGEYEATAEALTSRLTAIDKVGGRLSTAETSISQNATDISARLTTTQVNSLVDSKGLATATYVTNQITATATGIRTDLTKVEGKIDGLQVGGQNYVLDSKDLSKHLEARPTTTISLSTPNFEIGGKTDGWRFTVHGPGDAEGLRAILRSVQEPNTQYTLSLTVKENRNITIQVDALDPSKAITIGAGETKRVNFTTMSSANGQLQIRFLATGADVDASYIDVGLWGFKVEKGNIATDWSPAPEDTMMENDFTVFKNTYDSTVDSINVELSKTAKTEDLKGMVTESVLSTKEFVTAGTMATTLTNYAQTGNVPTNTQFNTLKNRYDSMEQTIGTNGNKIAQMVMTDSLFSTKVLSAVDIGGTNMVENSQNLGQHLEARPTTTISIATPNFEVDGHPDGWRFRVNGDGPEGLRTIIRKFLLPSTQYTLSITIKESRGVNMKVDALNPNDAVLIKPYETKRVSLTTMSEATGQIQLRFLSAGVDINAGYIEMGLWGLQIEKGNVATDWAPSPLDKADQSQVTQLADNWAVRILKGKNDLVSQINLSDSTFLIEAKNIVGIGDAVINGKLTITEEMIAGTISADKVSTTFITDALKGVNSRATMDSTRFRIDNSSGEFIEMNNTPEIRSDDAGGTTVILGRGRVHFYDKRGISKGYVGTDMHTQDSNDFGTFLSRGGGSYRFARMADATQATYATYTVKAGMTDRVSIIEDMVRTKLLPDGNANQFTAKSNMIAQMNGWPILPGAWPTQYAGNKIKYKELSAEVVGEAYQDIWRIGISTSNEWRTYFVQPVTFARGFVDNSDRRLKYDIANSEIEALSHIESLTLKSFKWKNDNRYEPIGLIAQDSGILRVNNDEYEGINTLRAVMLSLKGVKELHEIVKAQTEEIRQLKEIINQ